MSKTNKTAEKSRRSRPPAKTPEAREKELINLAQNLAYKQLKDGTAKTQIQLHYLKAGDEKSKLEKEIMKEQKALLKAKTDEIKRKEDTEKIYAEAIAAMKRYQGVYDED